MRNFKQLRIWQTGIQIAVQTYKLVSTFPKEERFGLTLQITRAAVSIASNIAEGSGRRSEKEYKRFLEISLGSSFELESQLLISESINFGNAELRSHILAAIDEEQKMLMTFMQKLAG